MNVSFSSDVRTPLRWMMAPAVVFTILLIAFPLAYTLWMSLQQYSVGESPRFIGAANYAQLAKDANFWHGLKITFVLYLLSLVLQLVAGTYLGVLLHSSKKMRGWLRSILISPFVLPPVVVGLMWMVLLDPSLGMANWLLSQVGIRPSLWLASPEWVIPTIALIDAWQWTPYVALIVVGGLQSLPPSVFEAAQIDGASRAATFRRITLPLLWPTIVTAGILRSVDLLRFFDIIYVTTQGGPGNASETLNIMAFRKAFEFFDFGYSSALMITLSTVVLAVTFVFLQVRKAVAW